MATTRSPHALSASRFSLAQVVALVNAGNAGPSARDVIEDGLGDFEAQLSPVR
jgi:hypothetical protein